MSEGGGEAGSGARRGLGLVALAACLRLAGSAAAAPAPSPVATAPPPLESPADSGACTAQVSPGADSLLAPLLREEQLGYAADLDTTGALAADSVHAQLADTLFYRLLANQSRAADEAVAALSRIYVGDREGDEVSCELQERGQRVLAHLRRFVRCVPRGRTWTVPPELVVDADFARDDLTSVELGETCEDE